MEWLGTAWHVPFQRIYWSVIYQFCIQWEWIQSFDFCYVAIQCHNASYYIAYKWWSIMVIRLNKQRDTIRWITISRYAFYHIIMQKFIALPSMSIPQTVQIHCSMRGSGKREGHDDVIKWKHFPRYWPFVRVIHRWPRNSPHKGQWRGALMFSLVCAWKKNDWGNNRETGDLRRHRAHHDVTFRCFTETHCACMDWSAPKYMCHRALQQFKH